MGQTYGSCPSLNLSTMIVVVPLQLSNHVSCLTLTVGSLAVLALLVVTLTVVALAVVALAAVSLTVVALAVVVLAFVDLAVVVLAVGPLGICCPCSCLLGSVAVTLAVLPWQLSQGMFAENLHILYRFISVLKNVVFT